MKHHTIKAYWWEETKLHAFLTSAPDGGAWSASAEALFLGKEPLHSLNTRLGEPQIQSGCNAEKKKSLLLLAIKLILSWSTSYHSHLYDLPSPRSLSSLSSVPSIVIP